MTDHTVSIAAVSARRFRAATVAFALLCAASALATIFGGVHGGVRDLQKRPIPGATVELRAIGTQWTRRAVTSADGSFTIDRIPLGDYELRVTASGMTAQSERIVIESGAARELAFDLDVAAMHQEVDVRAAASPADPKSSTRHTLVRREEVATTPGADRTNSLAMITGFLPGSTIVHDQLHVRGGHQVDWLIDGVPVPNTNIASNVGAQFDPKDIEALEIQSGGYSAEYGDRTFAVLNVVPRSGFESKREAGLTATFGEYAATDDHFHIASHTDRAAWYGAMNVSRSRYGLETPVSSVAHDAATGGGGFLSLSIEGTASSQFRIVAAVRGDRYDVPIDPADAEQSRDRERESDAFANGSWLRVLSKSSLLTISPFFHRNSADYISSANDAIAVDERRTSRYEGAQATFSGTLDRHDVRVGIFGFAQQDDTSLSLRDSTSGTAFSQADRPSGHLEAFFVEDRFDLTSLLTARLGARFTKFEGSIGESALSPRAAISLRLPHSPVVLRLSFADYYQPPPLSTASGPLLEFAAAEGFGFLPLRGERDRQYELGAGVPLRRWMFDLAAFRTDSRNFFDHDALGNSNLFFPLTIDRVRIRGLEATLRSSFAADRLDVHVALSHQRVEGRGGVTGGLTDFSPPGSGWFFLDHDQRDTIAAGVTARFGAGSWGSVNVAYGSGFLEGDGPSHLPAHATLDLGAGRTFGAWTAKVEATNVFNHRYLLDESNTFGGTHFNEPRQVSVQVGRRFRY